MPLILITSVLFVTFFSQGKGAYDESGEFVFQDYLLWNYTSTDPNCSIPGGRIQCQDIRTCNYAAVTLIVGGWPTLCGWVGKGVPKVCCDLPLILGPNLLKTVDAEMARRRACGTHFLPDNLSPIQKKFIEIAETLPPIDTDTPEKFDPPLELSPDVTTASPMKSNTRQGEFPWMVSVLEGGFHVCGGSLISRKHVLTAAHCVKTSMIKYSVNVGNLFAGTGYRIDVTEINTHPRFANRRPYHELVLLTLEEEILTPKIPHICLPDPNMDENILGKNVTLLLWGIKTTQDGKKRQWICVTEGLRIVSSETCTKQNVYGSDSIPQEMIEDYLCAQITESFQNECESGVGGLLMFQDSLTDSDPWFLIAVDSLEHTKAFNREFSRYALFARVSSYVDWIETKVGNVQLPGTSTMSTRA